MSQYSQYSYGQGQQNAPQYRSQTPSQQPPPQFEGQGSASYTGEQEIPQYGGQTSSQFTPPEPASGYGLQEPTPPEQFQPQYGQQEQDEGGYENTTNEPTGSQQPAQYNQGSQLGKEQQKQQSGFPQSTNRNQSINRNARTVHSEAHAAGGLHDHDYMNSKNGAGNTVKSQEMQSRQYASKRNYHPSHHNALHHMGKAASKF